jgi:hypothetical protein
MSLSLIVKAPTLASHKRNFGKLFTYLIIVSDLFHPDNIKNFHPSAHKISVSVHDYWKTYGGAKGIAQALRTDIKVKTT